jgi:hypothetical protein
MANPPVISRPAIASAPAFVKRLPSQDLNADPGQNFLEKNRFMIAQAHPSGVFAWGLARALL